MKTELPGPIQPLSAPTAAGASPGQAPIARNIILPPALAGSLERILIGTVTRQDGRGHVTVETKDGELHFVSRLTLPAGTRVTLELQSIGTTINAVILSINGKLTGTRGAPPGAQEPQTQVLNQQILNQKATPMGSPRPGAAAGPGGATNAGSPSGAGIQPGPVVSPGATPLAPGRILQAMLLGQTPPATAGAASALAPEASPEPMVIRILAIATALQAGTAQGPAAPAAPSAGDILTITGVVARSQSQGEIMLRTPLGSMAIATPTLLAPGSDITFEILTTSLASATPDRARIATEIASTWSSLREALTVLKADHPAIADALAARVLAQTGPGLAADLFGYIIGLKSRSARGWIGESAAAALEQAGRGDILARLGDEFALMAKLGHESPAGDWRTYLIPLSHGGNVQPLRLFMRRPRATRDDGRDPATRFVVEADLKSLGLLQLDGLSQPRRLDMIIRTPEPLPEQMRGDIEALFNANCAAARLDSSIRFQANTVFRVAPLDDIIPASGGGVVV